jgi:hypothetical protein
LHALLLLTRLHHAPHAATLARQKPQELIDIEETSVEAPVAPSSPAPSDAQVAANPTSASHPSAALRASQGSPQADPSGVDSLPGADAVANTGIASNPAAAGSAEVATAAPHKIDLHMDDGFFMRPPSEDLPRVHKPVVQQQLEAALSADDVRRGLARGNVFLGSLNAAAREAGPVRGEALLSVTVGADGSLSGIEFLRGSASDWSSAIASFRALAASKRLRVPPGARGVRVTFSVSAKVQRPSGKEVGSSGLDIGPMALSGTFDVADLGAGAARMVYAHVVSEEVL